MLSVPGGLDTAKPLSRKQNRLRSLGGAVAVTAVAAPVRSLSLRPLSRLHSMRKKPLQYALNSPKGCPPCWLPCGRRRLGAAPVGARLLAAR